MWNSIYYEGNSWRHTHLLQEAFKRSGQSTLQLEANESGREKLYKSFLREVVLPHSHRITSLLLDITRATFEDLLLLPSGLFDELECIKIHISSTYEYSSMPQATVFQGAPQLRRVTIPLSNNHSPLDLALPWDQLTYLALTPNFMELTDSFKVLSLCTNLSECHFCLCPDPEPPTVVPPASIQLPHLRKLRINMSRKSVYANYFRPLAIPNLEQFAFVLSDPSDDHLKDLIETIGRLSIPDLRLVLYYDGYGMDGLLRLAHSLPPLTSIKVCEYFLPTSMLELIAQDACFQTLTSLEAGIRRYNPKDLVEKFKLTVYWTRARQSNNVHAGIHSVMVEVVGTSHKVTSDFSRDIAVIQKRLGASDAKITLRRRRPHLGRSWLF